MDNLPTVNPSRDLASLPPARREQEIQVLCDRAIMDLTDAKTVQDVMNVLTQAQIIEAYARKHRAAVEAQGNCKIVVMLAEARIGSELMAAQARGELAHKNEPVSQYVQTTDIPPATLTDIGIPRQRAAEMKQLASVGVDAIKAEGQAAKAEGRLPSRRNLTGKAKPASHSRPRRPAPPPVINDRHSLPGAYSGFLLMVSSGARRLAELPSAQVLRADLERVREPMDLDQVRVLIAYLTAFLGDDE